ncbi:MAG: heavy-metal-associated domain-containing protein [SAR324 cluster bacterium]|jgi:copper chaperone CopZ|nr:heavy-metal-associated domain-containing protein [SAR324 cluster bacterium]MCH2266397.1 heavy-metal-associated domain-containing protein [SAR324 cluster bacterium]|tara:strand:- start:330 stop:542 length:213 start_codon:yes stop_codon:yes gene_type:complete
MEKLKWRISGMHCDGCSARLQKVLSGKTGVQSAEVSFADNQALLEYDSEIISAEQLQDAVENAGFEIASA